MKAKKLLAGILAGTMVLSSAVTVSAATLDKGTLTCTTFWGEHSSGVAIKEQAVTFTFNAKSTGAGANSYESPVYVVYSSDNGKAYSANADDADGQKHKYKEYLVCRSDVYAWTSAGATGWGNDGVAIPNALGSGYGFTGTPPADGGETWTTYFAEQMQKVQKGTITAYISGKNAIVNFKIAGAESTATIPVSSTKDLYIGLTGEKCNITNMQYEYSTVSQDDVKVSLTKTKYTYNGKTQKPGVKVTGKDGKAIDKANYTVSYPKSSKKAGSYKVTVSFKNDYKDYVARELSYTIKKASQKITAKLSSSTVKLSKAKKKNQTVNLYVKGNKASLSVTPSSKKQVTVKKGKAIKSGKYKGYTQYKVTIKKTKKKATYSIKVYAKSSSNYSKSSTKTLKIKVK